MAKFCTNCGTKLPEDQKFCTNCGMALNNEETPKELPGKSAPSNEALTESDASAVPFESVQPRTTAQKTYQQPTPVQPTYQQPQAAPVQPVYQPQAPYGVDTEPPKGSKYEPISTLGYIGIMLLMCIPIVGQLLLILWALGGCKKVNQRNLARASLIMMAAGIILSVFIGMTIKRKIDNTIAQIERQTGFSLSGDSNEASSDGLADFEDLSQLIGMLGGAAGSSGSSGNEGSHSKETAADISNYLENVEKINKDAEKANDGWPKTLREYPDGTVKSVASYRTEISDTTEEEVLAWIDDLKKDGFEYQDFYDFGISEEDMLSMTSWWGTDGEIFISVSFSEGTVTVDHVNELPNIEDYFK